MFITIVNDSSNDNARVRQIVRWSTLFPKATISFVGIDSNLENSATLTAGGNLVDILDASDGREGIVALNVAPRGEMKDGENGPSFCYFWYKKTLVVPTIKGYTLSLVKKFNIVKNVNLLDTKGVLDFAFKKGLIDNWLNSYIAKSQFRSFDFQPRVAN